MIDPLDGSYNIDVNVSVGTIFSIYRRIASLGTLVITADFLQAGDSRWQWDILSIVPQPHWFMLLEME